MTQFQENNKQHKVVVLGASNKPERYSNRAIKMLKSANYSVIPIHPRLKEIDGFQVLSNLAEIKENVHTLTLYTGPARMESMIEDIIALRPDRVILNPGTESESLMKRLDEETIPYLRACTLVMLQTQQF